MILWPRETRVHYRLVHTELFAVEKETVDSQSRAARESDWSAAEGVHDLITQTYG